MPTTSFSNTFSHATNAPLGRVQADGYYSPVTLGQPTSATTGNHSLGPAQFPSGIAQTVTTGITARAGGGQGSATLLTTAYNNVTVVATAADSVKLPATPSIGQTVTVKNSAANAMAVFPNTGQSINGGSVNASVSQAAGSVANYVYVATNSWVSF